MTSQRARRWGLIGLGIVLVLAIGAVVGFRMAVGVIKDKIVAALGPGSEIQELGVGWSAVEVVGLRIRGPAGWPTADALRAERVAVVPSLRSLLSGEIRVSSITVVRPYLSALRTKDGRLRVVPSLLERPAAKGQGGTGVPASAVRIERITLEDGVVELYDATVASPPLKIRVEQLRAAMRDVLVPALTGQTAFDLSGVVKGVRHDGRAAVKGWAEVATKDSSVKMELRGVDLVLLQPYLSKAAEVRIQKGALDLDLQSDVRKNRLKAPGKVSIANLEFAPGKGGLDTFMGMPRGAVLAFLKDKNDKITVNFALEGDINNPQFSLNEVFSTRLAASMAESLGVSIRGVAEGAGSLGRKGADVVWEAAKGIGGAFQSLFGGAKK
jgi:hypothetical protein